MRDKPFLSVVMPIHDGAQWIGATLDSVASEPTKDIEVIVIDSSASDTTASIVEGYANRFALQLVRRPDVTPWQIKTNIGIELASADRVCILHQDDLWLPGRVESVRRWIAKAPHAALHLAPSRLIDRHGRNVGRWSCPVPSDVEIEPQFLLESLLVQNFVSMPAPVFRVSSWLECKGMDEGLWYTPDWDIWLRLSKVGPVVYHDEMTTAFRLHGSSLTVTGSRNASEFCGQMETVLERHLGDVLPTRRAAIERLARASIAINVSLAAASGGSARGLATAARNVLALGPAGIPRYLRNSRLAERVVSRLRAKVSGAT